MNFFFLYKYKGQCYTELDKHEHALAWYYKAYHEKSDHVPALLTVARAQVEHPFKVWYYPYYKYILRLSSFFK